MNRKEFIKSCGTVCLGPIAVGLAGISLLQNCKPAKQVPAVTGNNQLQIDKREFEVMHKEKKSFRKSIVTKPEHSDFPIVVYRFSENEYTALLLRCTHQSSELNLNGDIMTCSAHGSEFNNRGEVIQGPAEQKLHAFKVTSDAEKIYVHLV